MRERRAASLFVEGGKGRAAQGEPIGLVSIGASHDRLCLDR